MPTELAGIAVVPLIIGLVEVAKRMGLAARWAAPLSVCLGLAVGLGAYAMGDCGAAPGAAAQPTVFPCNSLFDALLVGLALGLSATGLYSGARKTLEA
jgi:hypothetical protein